MRMRPRGSEATSIEDARRAGLGWEPAEASSRAAAEPIDALEHEQLALAVIHLRLEVLEVLKEPPARPRSAGLLRSTVPEDVNGRAVLYPRHQPPPRTARRSVRARLIRRAARRHSGGNRALARLRIRRSASRSTVRTCLTRGGAERREKSSFLATLRNVTAAHVKAMTPERADMRQ